tara:strand:+ start:246 stop:884 length:639 start_codon:yes stop_codon:yes gene_type:complete
MTQQMVFTPNIIGMNDNSMNKMINSAKVSNNARHSGPIITYEFKSLDIKKQMKELKKVLLPQKKKFLFKKYGFRFNIRDRCVVCGVHHVWEPGDNLRPPIPLSHVTKGRPLRGTYCPRHSSLFRQMEMLEQQVIAEKHGLEFKKYIPKPKVPGIMKSGPLATLSEKDIISLTSKGWEITPPSTDTTTAEEKLFTLLVELKGKIGQIDELIGD